MTVFKIKIRILVAFFNFIFTPTCFFPEKNSKIISNRKITMKTLSTLLNEFFTLDINENEVRVKNFGFVDFGQVS